MRVEVPAYFIAILVCIGLNQSKIEGGKPILPVFPGNIAIEWESKAEGKPNKDRGKKEKLKCKSFLPKNIRA